MKEFIMNAGALLLVTIGIILIERIAGMLSMFLKKKKSEAEIEGKKALMTAFAAADKILTAVTSSTVAKIETTKAAKIREAVHAGQMANEELNILSEEAYQEIVSNIGTVVTNTFDSVMEDSEVYIRNKIEQVLPEIKAEYAMLNNHFGESYEDYEGTED